MLVCPQLISSIQILGKRAMPCFKSKRWNGTGPKASSSTCTGCAEPTLWFLEGLPLKTDIGRIYLTKIVATSRARHRSLHAGGCDRGPLLIMLEHFVDWGIISGNRAKRFLESSTVFWSLTPKRLSRVTRKWFSR